MPSGRPLIAGAPRDHRPNIRFTADEFKAVSEHAAKRGLSLSEHARDILMKACRGEIKIDAPVQAPLF